MSDERSGGVGRLAGKVAVITGAANGIGAAAVARFAAAGAAVVAADRDHEGAEVVAEQARAAGGRAVACGCDVREESDLVAALDLADETFGGLDVLFSNATVGRDDDLDIVRTTDRAWEHQYRTTFASVALGARHAVARMTERGGGGALVHTASLQAMTGDHVRIAYGAMKAAVLALTRSIATTHGRHAIRANAIAPGLVLTPKIETVFPPEALARIRAHQPLPWATRPEDVADLALFLASDESRCITGQTIVIDGGSSIAGSSTYELAELFGLTP